jgi:hypothetical protein
VVVVFGGNMYQVTFHKDVVAILQTKRCGFSGECREQIQQFKAGDHAYVISVMPGCVKRKHWKTATFCLDNQIHGDRITDVPPGTFDYKVV